MDALPGEQPLELELPPCPDVLLLGCHIALLLPHPYGKETAPPAGGNPCGRTGENHTGVIPGFCSPRHAPVKLFARPLSHILWNPRSSGLATTRCCGLAGGREETTSAVCASPRGSGGPALRGSGSFALLEQDAQLAFEVRELLEVLVHAGESKVRHIIQAAQQGQDLDPYL